MFIFAFSLLVGCLGFMGYQPRPFKCKYSLIVKKISISSNSVYDKYAV